MAQTRQVTRSAALPLHDDGSLRLAVVADTHSQPHPATIGHLASLRPDAILHAGDIGDLGVLDGLAAVAPVLAVRGNIDAHARDLPDVLVLDVGAGALRILMLHIGVYGPKLRGEVARLARAQETSLVVCGHSHVPFIGRDAGLGVFNPGSAGPRRFHLPIVFGMMELSPAGVRLRHIDCESGNTWLPPA
jgi:putative phosphoesterase